MKKVFAVLLMTAVIITLIAGCTEPIPNPTPTPEKTETPTSIPAPEPALADPIETDSGLISGTVIGEAGSEIHVYKGIPYAAPPVGDLRWQPPQPPAHWTGVRECTQYSMAAPQNNPFFTPTFEQSEDCLYLNVMTPAKRASDKLPVMVWMHGGAYSFGTGNDPSYNLPGLPQHDVVLVTVNMRLGTLGLLAHPLLNEESPQGVSGNYMFLDMIAALEWVQSNIGAFGGDPDNVTIFGSSTGGSKVAALMASPLTEGLFHKAILQSGTAMEGYFPGIPLKDMEEIGEEIFASLGVDNENDALAAARNLPWEDIVGVEGVLNMDASIDSWFLTDFPANIFERGNQNPIPFITVANLGEITGPGIPILTFPCLIPGYTNMLANVDKVGVRGYTAIFKHVPGNWKNEGGVAVHWMELPYVFGDMDPESDQWHTIFAHSRPSGVTQEAPELTYIDRELSDNIMTMWAQFARTGDPNVTGLVEWPAYDPSGDHYLVLDILLRVKSGFSEIAPQEPTATPTPTAEPGHPGSFEVSGTHERMDLVYDFDPLEEDGNWVGQGTTYWDIHGTLEGTCVIKFTTIIGLDTGKVTGEGETTFTVTVNGKQGTFTTRDVKTGQMLNKVNGFVTIVCEIISGTGELANLRGTITFKNHIDSKGMHGTYSGTLWFED